MISIDKKKYIEIAKSQGVGVALTQLYKDVERWEYQTFEGEQGWKPEMWTDLEDIRRFSRELWEMDQTKVEPKI